MAERTSISIFLDLNEKEAIPRLEEQVAKLRKQINGVEKGTKEFDLALKKLEDGKEGIKKINSEIQKFEKNLESATSEAEKATIEKSLRNLRAELAKSTKETEVFAKKINGLDRESKEYAQTVQKLNEKEERLNIARLKSNGVYSASLKDLAKIINKVEGELKDMSREQAGFTEKRQLLQKIKQEYRNLKNEIDGINPVLEKQKSYWNWFKMTFASTFLSEIASNIFQNIFGSIQTFIRGTFQNAADLDDALAKANKGLDVGVETLKMLKNELKQVDTRTPLEELIKMMEILGNAGIPAQQISEGVKAMNNVRVAMGDEFADIETMTRELSKLLNLSKDLAPLEDFSTRLSYMGNILNAMSATGSAFAPEVVDIMKRTLPIMQEFNITTEQTAALATTISELGFNPELGATALNTLLKRAAENMGVFANFVQKADVGLNASGFQKLFAQDTYAALLKLLQALKKGGGDAIQIANLFKDLEVSGQGVSTVFTALSANTDLLSSRLKVAQEAATNTNSIMGEVSKMENTYAAEIAKLQKNLATMFSNSDIVEGYYNIIGMLADVTESTEKQSVSLKKQQNLVNLLTHELILSETPLERRKEIEKELNAIAPQILKNLDWEAQKYDTLRKNLEAYNEAQIHRITLARKEEGIERKRQEAADLYEKQQNLRTEFVKYLQNIDERLANPNKGTYNVAFGSGAAVPMFSRTGIDTEGSLKPNFAKMAQESASMVDALTAMSDKLELLSSFTNAENVKKDLERIVYQYVSTEIEFQLRKAQVAEMEKNKLAFMKEMGLEPTPTPNPVIKTAVEDSKSMIVPNLQPEIKTEKVQELDNWLTQVLNQKPTNQQDIIKSYDILIDKIKTAGVELLQEEQITQDEYNEALRITIEKRQQAVFDYQKSVRENQEKEAEQALQDLEKSLQEEKELREFTNLMNLNLIEDEKEKQRKEEEEAQQAHYTALREKAKKYYQEEKIDLQQYIAWLEMITVKQRIEREKSNADAKKAKKIERADEVAEQINVYGDLASSIGSMFGAMSEFIDAAGIRNAKLAKNLATFKIAADAASAIAANVALSVQAAAVGGPAAPFLIAGYVASGLATIFSSINQAKRILNAAPNVELSNSDKSSRNPANIRKYGDGGFTGLVDGKSHSNGGEIIEVEGGEYVANKKMVKNNLSEFHKIEKLSKNENARFWVFPRNYMQFVPNNEKISQTKTQTYFANFSKLEQMMLANALQINELSNMIKQTENKPVVLSLRNLSEQNQKYTEITNQNITNGANKLDT